MSTFKKKLFWDQIEMTIFSINILVILICIFELSVFIWDVLYNC